MSTNLYDARGAADPDAPPPEPEPEDQTEALKECRAKLAQCVCFDLPDPKENVKALVDVVILYRASLIAGINVLHASKIPPTTVEHVAARLEDKANRMAVLKARLAMCDEALAPFREEKKVV